MQQVSVSIQYILDSIDELKHVVIAYSGGVDSHVLLHACAFLRETNPQISFQAVHVNHGMQSASKQWTEHCQSIASQLGLDIQCIAVNVTNIKQDGPEQAARKARYSAIAKWVDQYTVVLTAQHQDDQAETLLLQLLRGCGVDGLSGMPLLDRFSAGYIARPLLKLNQKSVMDYAKTHDLTWIEDPSNKDTSLDRNFLRREIIPVIKQRWPAFAETTSRTAQHCAETSDVLSQVADKHLTKADANKLSINEIIDKDPKLQRILLRYWIQQNRVQRPSLKVIQQVQSTVIGAYKDKTPVVKWGAHELRRFNNYLYLMPALPSFDSELVIQLNKGVCQLPPLLGVIKVIDSLGEGICATLWDSEKTVIRFREGGELIKLAKRQGTKKLKALFHENHIFPWVRGRIPLIYINGQLAAIADLWVAEEFQATEKKPSYALNWEHPELEID